jgi:hypothetical protein
MNRQEVKCRLLLEDQHLVSIHLQDEGKIFVLNVGRLLTDYTVL